MPSGVDEHQLPIVSRWSTQALGTVEGPRVRRPRDPVAAWLLRRFPDLAPTFQVPAVLCMIRERSSVNSSQFTDEQLTQKVSRPTADGESVQTDIYEKGINGRVTATESVVEKIER